MCMDQVSRRSLAMPGLLVTLGLAGGLPACGGPGPVRSAPTIAGVPDYGDGYLSCVPYARARSGIELRGDAWQWWEAASGRYLRGRQPQPRNVLVFARTRRLPSGHLSVVRRVISDREIRVDHANWAEAGGGSRGRVAEDQPVLDVSAANDWSRVRVWYPPVRDYGNTVFVTQGFVSPRLVMAGG